MRSFLVIHHTERFVLIPAFEKFNGFISDNIRRISFFYDMLAVFPKVRVVVIALFMLTAKDAPMIEPLRFTDKMPFTNHGSLVSGLLEKLGECLLVTVECTCVIGETIFMTEFTGKDTST